MLRLVKIHIIFLIVALIIAFALIPIDMMYLRKLPEEELSSYFNGAFNLENTKAWKIFFTWFLGLTCGRLMLRALMK